MHSSSESSPSRPLSAALPLLLDATSELVACLALDGRRVSDWNRSAETAFGRSRDEFGSSGASWIDAVHSEDRAALSIQLTKLAPDIWSESAFRIEQPSGAVCWLEARLRAIRLGGDREPFALLVATDVTAQRNSAKEMADALAEHRSLTDQMPLSLIRKDAQGRRTFVNRHYCEQHGVTADTVLGKSDFDLFPAALARKYAADDRRVMERGEVLHDNEELAGLNGTRRVINRVKSPIRNEEGRIVGVQVLFWDVTEDVAARKALRESDAHYQSLVESLPLSVFRKDSGFRFVFGNKRFCEALSDPLESFRGKTDFDLFPQDLAAKYRSDDQRILEAGVTIEAIEEMIHADGQRFYIQTFKGPVRAADGHVIGIQGMFWDVTAQQRAEQELRKAKAASDAASKAKSDFLANMSHEIRTPMNAVIGMTELVLDTELTNNQREYLSIVQESGDALLTLINDVLDFSKIEAGKFELDPAIFDVRETLGDTMKSLAVRASRQGLELAFEIDGNVPFLLEGDYARLRQIVINLVGNAIKFTPHGEVVLTVRCESRTETEALLRFSVTDTGIGIPADKQGLVFEEFQQADSSTTRTYGGTGLGLAISSRLVELMHGRIWLESEVGRGSTFHFTAQMSVPNEATQRVERRTDVVAETNVLIVDDNATNRRILGEMVCNWGMRPVLASNAHDALRLLRESSAQGNSIGLILSDVNMPEVSGFMLAEWIRAESQFDKTQIIMLTSSGREGDAARRDELNIAARLMKPIKQSELFDAIVTTLGVAALDSPPRPTDEERSALAVRPLNVLLAEDNAANQKLAVGVLTKQGHRVTVAGNGRLAIAEWQMQPFDVILMDVQMPELDGLQATQAIRDREARQGGHTFIVAMTAHAMKGDRERCLEAGMDDYLPKPIRAKLLAEKLLSLFGPSCKSEPTAVSSSSVATPIESLPVALIDWKAALEGVDDDRSLLAEVAQLFLSSTTTTLTGLGEAIRLSQPDVVQRLSHSLKGELLAIGAVATSEFAWQLEQCGSQHAFAEALPMLAQLSAQIELLRTPLADFVRDNLA